MELPRWQLAAFVNAVLSWTLYCFADWVLMEYGREGGPTERLVDGTVGVLKVVRGVLTIYTIAATLYIAASLVERWGLPRIGEYWFPRW